MTNRNDNWLVCTRAQIKIKSILDTLVWEDQITSHVVFNS